MQCLQNHLRWLLCCNHQKEMCREHKEEQAKLCDLFQRIMDLKLWALILHISLQELKHHWWKLRNWRILGCLNWVTKQFFQERQCRLKEYLCPILLKLRHLWFSILHLQKWLHFQSHLSLEYCNLCKTKLWFYLCIGKLTPFRQHRRLELGCPN